MKMMFIHGIGYHEEPQALAAWVATWSDAIRESSKKLAISLDFENPLGPDGLPGGDDDPGILYYEDIIRSHPAPRTRAYGQAVGSFVGSYLSIKARETAERFGSIFRRRRFLDDGELAWKARQVVSWSRDEELRRALRQHVIAEIRRKDPKVVVAHSFGGLITYDACMFEDPELLDGRYFVTLGTQIGNPLLRKEFAGMQLPVQALHWFNLYNPGDRVFVSPLDHIRAPNFTHLVTDHDQGHDGAGYLGHHTTADVVWRSLSTTSPSGRGTRSIRPLATVRRKPENRALLVGIDEFSHPAVPPLQGCVNDTYQLSAALQDTGFDHASIRMLHNQRATRENLIDHLEWLLDDPKPGDHRFFSFSGHGHRMPSFDFEGNAAEMDEILVTHDYAFTETTGLRDRDFQDLYAYLPHDLHFLIFLDCCHSGGMTRSGGQIVRSFMGPSDLEHEHTRWNRKLQMWEQVGLGGSKGINEEFLPPAASEKWKKTREKRSIKEFEQVIHRVNSLYYGELGDLRRIGRATQLRDLPHDKYDRISNSMKAMPEGGGTGPYLPLVFMACGETELAFEYVHGSVHYGAFTYAMAQVLRDCSGDKNTRPSYEELLHCAADKLRQLGYTQTPEILGHKSHRTTVVPFAD